MKLLRADSLSTPSVKVESGFLNSFVSFISMSTENSANSVNRPRTVEEEESAKLASKCVRECNVENLVSESKFLIVDSLKCLVENLVSICQNKFEFLYVYLLSVCLLPISSFLIAVQTGFTEMSNWL